VTAWQRFRTTREENHPASGWFSSSLDSEATSSGAVVTHTDEAGSSDPTPDRRGWRGQLRFVAAVLALIAIAASGWYLFIREVEPPGPPAPILEVRIDEPVSGIVDVTDWSSPSAVAVDGDRIFVLDTGNNRILVMNIDGLVEKIICETDACALLLDGPQDMEYHDGLFYVANTQKGQVVVVDESGETVRVYELPVTAGIAPQATGVHVPDEGTVYVSDGSSGKIAMFDRDGTFRQYFGADTVGEFVFADPTGLDTDSDGNLYVAEYSKGRVLKISPIGRDLATFWMIEGSTKVSEASDVVLDDDGFVYMADFKRSVVHAFSRGARAIGLVGLIDGSRIDSPIALLRPQGLAVDGDRLLIIDQRRGLLVYTVDTEFFLFRSARSQG